MKMKHKKGKEAMAKAKKANLYNAASSPEVAEAENKKPGFKDGGKVSSKKSHKRLDKSSRKKMAAGGSPLSEAHKTSQYKTGGAGAGMQGDGPSGEDNSGD